MKFQMKFQMKVKVKVEIHLSMRAVNISLRYSLPLILKEVLKKFSPRSKFQRPLIPPLTHRSCPHDITNEDTLSPIQAARAQTKKHLILFTNKIIHYM